MTLSLTDLRPGVAYVVDYCLDWHAAEPELQTLEAIWTGEIDSWGKYTFKPIDGGEPHYLFTHELVMLDYATDNQQPWPPTWTMGDPELTRFSHYALCKSAALFDGR